MLKMWVLMKVRLDVPWDLVLVNSSLKACYPVVIYFKSRWAIWSSSQIRGQLKHLSCLQFQCFDYCNSIVILLTKNWLSLSDLWLFNLNVRNESERSIHQLRIIVDSMDGISKFIWRSRFRKTTPMVRAISSFKDEYCSVCHDMPGEEKPNALAVGGKWSMADSKATKKSSPVQLRWCKPNFGVSLQPL